MTTTSKTTNKTSPAVKVSYAQIINGTYNPIDKLGDVQGMTKQHIVYDRYTGGYKVEVDIYTHPTSGEGYEKRVYRPLNDKREMANIAKRRDKEQSYYYQ